MNLNHTVNITDGVFIVVIALPVMKLTKHIQEMLYNPQDMNIIIMLLLMISSLVFSVFYWIEIKKFLEEQMRFIDALGSLDDTSVDSVPVPLMAQYLLGYLCMMALMFGIFTFADAGQFQAFLVANLIFWIADCFGTISLRRSYRPYAKTISRVKMHTPAVHRWFIGHITSRYFLAYGIGNILYFAALLFLDHLFSGSIGFRVVASCITFLFVLFRHLYWRSRIYWWWVTGRNASDAKKKSGNTTPTTA